MVQQGEWKSENGNKKGDERKEKGGRQGDVGEKGENMETIKR